MRILLFIPVALLGAVADLLLVGLSAEPAWGPVVHLLFWAPAFLLVLGLLRVYQGRSVGWVLAPLALLSILFGVGLTLENWPLHESPQTVWLWLVALIAGPLGAWAGRSHRRRTEVA